MATEPSLNQISCSPAASRAANRKPPPKGAPSGVELASPEQVPAHASVRRSVPAAVPFVTQFSRLLFEGGFDDRNVTMIDVELDYRRRFGKGLSTIGRLGYRFEDDSISGETHAWDAVLGFKYVMGELSSELTLEYDRLKLPGSEDEEFGLYFRLRRNLGDVFTR